MSQRCSSCGNQLGWSEGDYCSACWKDYLQGVLEAPKKPIEAPIEPEGTHPSPKPNESP